MGTCPFETSLVGSPPTVPAGASHVISQPSDTCQWEPLHPLPRPLPKLCVVNTLLAEASRKVSAALLPRRSWKRCGGWLLPICPSISASTLRVQVCLTAMLSWDPGRKWLSATEIRRGRPSWRSHSNSVSEPEFKSINSLVRSYGKQYLRSYCVPDPGTPTPHMVKPNITRGHRRDGHRRGGARPLLASFPAQSHCSPPAWEGGGMNPLDGGGN